MASLPITPLWYASGLRWLAGLIESLADRLERSFGAPQHVTAHDLHFDSDIYLAEIKYRAMRDFY